MPYDKALGTFFIRRRIKIPHQPFLSYLLILLSFLVLSPILGLILIYLLRQCNLLNLNYRTIFANINDLRNHCIFYHPAA
ncbi:MAG TPA: hypothetical protein HPP56_09660 [Nitrospirae bacterium]|nr:hypothetical protein [Nitrospirota bacterium]